MTWPFVLLALLLLAGACATSEPASEASPLPTDEESDAVPDSPDETSTTTVTVPSAETTEAPTPADLDDPAVVFLTLVDEALVDTDWAGVTFDAPEVFLANGQLMCAQLGDGSSIDEVLSEFAATLTELPVEDINDDTATLAGALLGTAVATLCPEHEDILENAR
jgi:hypothetical protein